MDGWPKSVTVCVVTCPVVLRMRVSSAGRCCAHSAQAILPRPGCCGMSFQLPLTTTWKIRRTRRETYLGALLRLTTGEKKRFWDKATDSGQWRVAPAPRRLWTDLTDGRMEKMRMQRAWNLGARLAACYWIHTKPLEIGSWVKVRRNTALMESVRRLCLRVENPCTGHRFRRGTI